MPWTIKFSVLVLAVFLSVPAANAQTNPIGGPGWRGWGSGMMMGPGMMSARQFGMMCDPRSAGFAQWSFNRSAR